MLRAGPAEHRFSSNTSWMFTAPDLSMSCSPTTCTGASEVMFGDTMREPVTTIVSGAPFCVSWRSLRRRCRRHFPAGAGSDPSALH